MKKNNSEWINQLRRQQLQASARNPGTAALMSFFFMGMGQIYAGHIDRGIMLLGLHLAGLFTAFSLYGGGIVYKTVFPLLGAHLLVIACYAVSVIFVLVWIYNIKDAYYLALFSSFRDWFEVERVMLPVLRQQAETLLTGPECQAQLVADSAATRKKAAEEYIDGSDDEEELVEPEPIPVFSENSPEKAESVEPVANAQTVFPESCSVVAGIQKRSWKLYAGFAAILVLVGLWINRNYEIDTLQHEDTATLFAVSARIPGEKTTEIAAASAGAVALPTSSPATEILVQTVEKDSPQSQQPQQLQQGFVPFAAGLEKVSQGDFAAAAELFSVDLAAHEPSASQWKLILNTFFRADLKVEYETSLRRYLESFPDDAAAWFNLGKVLYDRSELQQAAQAIANGLKHDNDSIRGNYLLGSIYHDLKLYDDATTYLKKAVELEPLNPEFNQLLAKTLAAAGKGSDAARYYQRVLSISPDDREARAAVFSGNPSAAVAIGETGDNSVVVIQGKQEARLVEKNSESALPKALTGKVLFDSSAEDADEKRIIESDLPIKDSASVQQNVAEPAVIVKPIVPEQPEAGKPAVAVGQTKPAGNSGISELEVVSAVPNQKADSNSPTVVDLRDSVAVDNDSGLKKEIEALRRKGSAEFSKGNWEAALPVYLEILRKKKDSQTYDMVGMLFEKLAMPKDAFVAVEHAYKLGQRDSATLARLGRLADQLGDRAKGEFYLYHALQKMPHRIDMRIRYAVCLEANGKTEQALKELEKILAAGGESYAIKRRAELEIQKIKAKKK